MPFGGLLTAGAGLVSGMMGNNAKADAQNAQNQMSAQQIKAQQQAYQEMLQRAAQAQQSGEQSFLAEANAPTPEFQKAQQDLANRESQGYKELQTGLVQQGVRGGQAATQLRRGAGDLQNNLDRYAAEEAARRKQAKLGYFGQKAQTGLTGQMNANGMSGYTGEAPQIQKKGILGLGIGPF